MNGQPTEIALRCVYQRVWDDGFGARGWKLATAVADPEIIASTAATGDRIPTSVFVHDILDHALCGLGTSGHRNEAIALIQLASRTGADPTTDFAQMVDEDLLQGRVLGESFRSFLPDDLVERLPAAMVSGRQVVDHLAQQLGRSTLRTRLIAHFSELGLAGAPSAARQFRRHGLDYQRRKYLGLAIQQLLQAADDWVQQNDWASATGSVAMGIGMCRFCIDLPSPWSARAAY